MKSLLQGILLFGVVLLTPKIWAQSDGCAGIPSLTVGASCVTTAYSLPGSFSNGGLVVSSCNGTNRDDGWFSFTATSTFSQVTATAVSEDLTLAIWTACGGGTEVTCGTAIAGGTVSVSFATTVGTVYYIQLHRSSGNGTASMSGTVCVRQIPPPPTNDNCTGAINVPVNTGNICVTSVSGSIASSTASSQANGCFGTADDDVWYSFVATNTTHYVNLNNVAGSTTDLYHNVYGGTCGAPGAELICSDPNNSTVTGLTIGNTYYVRVYSWTSTPGQTSTFDICIGTPPPPPGNDNCPGATNVPVNPGITCTSTVAGTIASASASSQANTCGGTADDDVWYSFVATNPTQYINLNNVAGSTTDLYHSVYSGTCGSIGAPLICSDPNNSTVSGLTPGNTYYVRVYSWTSAAGQTSTFNVCITTPPPPPANDECSGAVSIPVSPSTCSYTAGTIASATTSPQAIGGCFGTADDDVWYSFVATTPAVNISLTNVVGSTTDLYHNVYSGTCGAPGTALVCSDPNSSTVTGLTPGNTYFVRVYSWGSTPGQTTTFDICVLAAGACGTPNNQDYCVAPAILTPGPGNFSANTSGSYTQDQPANLGSVFCGSIENNSWYEFVATSTSHTFNFTNVSGPGCTYGVQAQVYAVTEDVNGCCTNFTSTSNCFNPATPTLGSVNATGLTIGQTYRLMVDGNAASVCDFTISNWTATGIIPLGVMYGDFSALILPEGNAIRWETSVEKNNDFFELERSSDGVHFERIATIEGQGTKNAPSNYNYMDDYRLPGLVYYRLRQVDLDGTASYSEVLTINRTQTANLELSPNPAKESIMVGLNNKGINQISVLGLNGLTLLRKTVDVDGSAVIMLDLSELASGLYIIQAVNETGEVSVKQFIKQ